MNLERMLKKLLGRLVFGVDDVESELKRLGDLNASIGRELLESEKRLQDLESAMRDVIVTVQRSAGIYVTNRTLFELMFDYVRKVTKKHYLYLHVDDVTTKEEFVSQILIGLGVAEPMKWNEAMASFIALSPETPILFIRIDAPPTGEFKAIANGLQSWQQGRNIKIILYSAWKVESLGSFLETVSACMGMDNR